MSESSPPDPTTPYKEAPPGAANPYKASNSGDDSINPYEAPQAVLSGHYTHDHVAGARVDEKGHIHIPHGATIPAMIVEEIGEPHPDSGLEGHVEKWLHQNSVRAASP